MAPFEIRDGGSGTPGFTGKTVAAVFLDEMQAVIEEAEEFKGRTLSEERVKAGQPTISTLSGTLPELLDRPAIEMEVGGISFQKALLTLQAIRRGHRLVTGDVVAGPEGLVLRIRTEGGGYWVGNSFPATAAGLEGASRELALKMLSALSADVAGRYFLSRKKYDEALRVYKEWLHREPDRFEPNLYRGLALKGKGEKEMAIAAFEKALALRPDEPFALRFMADTLEEQGCMGCLDQAIAAYKRSLDVRPKDLATLNNLGIALNNKGQHDEAIAAYNKSLSLDPDDPVTLYNLGNALSDKGKLDEAIAAYNNSLSLRPDDPDTLNNLGNALRKKDRVDEAIAAYNKALTLSPDDPVTLYNLGIALFGKGRLDEAIAVYNKALSLSPDHPATLNNLGNALFGKGQFDEAIAAYQKSLSLRPDHLDTLKNLGIALRGAGREDEAKQAFEKAQQLKPGMKPPE